MSNKKTETLAFHLYTKEQKGFWECSNYLIDLYRKNTTPFSNFRNFNRENNKIVSKSFQSFTVHGFVCNKFSTFVNLTLSSRFVFVMHILKLYMPKRVNNSFSVLSWTINTIALNAIKGLKLNWTIDNDKQPQQATAIYTCF